MNIERLEIGQLIQFEGPSAYEVINVDTIEEKAILKLWGGCNNPEPLREDLRTEYTMRFIEIRRHATFLRHKSKYVSKVSKNYNI